MLLNNAGNTKLEIECVNMSLTEVKNAQRWKMGETDCFITRGRW